MPAPSGNIRGPRSSTALLAVAAVACVRWFAGCGTPESFHDSTGSGGGGGAGGINVQTGNGGHGGGNGGSSGNGGSGGAAGSEGGAGGTIVTDGGGGGATDALPPTDATDAPLDVPGVGGGGGAAGAGGGGTGGGSAGRDGGAGGAAGGRDGGTGGVGGAGATGGGGAGGGAGASACNPGYQPINALLSDFGVTTWSPSTLKWGFPGDLTGSIFSYKGVAAATTWNPISVSTGAANPALVMGGNVAAGDYAGGGMAFSQCVHTTAYTGLTFTLSGTTASCDLFFAIQTFSQQSTGNGGGCNTATTSCFQFPKVKVTIGAAPIVVRFTDLANTGQPSTAAGIAAEIIGLQWQAQSAALLPCTGVSFSIDNVSFTTN